MATTKKNIDYYPLATNLRWGYNIAAVRPCVLVCLYVSVCVCLEYCEQDRRQSYHHRSIKPSTNVPHGQKMDPIDFQGQGSNVKITMDLTLKTL